jgi:SAM-dependent methyltransferase
MWPTEENRRAWDEIHAEEEAVHAPLPDAVRERLPDLEGKHVLQLQCGEGHAIVELIALGALVTGVDASEAALAAARERAPDAALFQADPHELPLELRRGRFDLVYAGEGALSDVHDLEPWASGPVGALRSGGELMVHDWHPVAACVDPVGLRWKESYFAGVWQLGQIVTAVAGAGLVITSLEELPPQAPRGRVDARIPADFILRATKPQAAVGKGPKRRRM